MRLVLASAISAGALSGVVMAAPLHNGADRTVISGHCNTLMVQMMNRKSLCPKAITLLTGIEGTSALYTGGEPGKILGVEITLVDRTYRMFGFANTAQPISAFDHFYRSGATGFGFWVARIEVEIAGDITPTSTTTARCEYVKSASGKRAIACMDHRTAPTFLISFVED